MDGLIGLDVLEHDHCLVAISFNQLHGRHHAPLKIESDDDGPEHLFHGLALWCHHSLPVIATARKRHFEVAGVVDALAQHRIHHDAGDLLEHLVLRHIDHIVASVALQPYLIAVEHKGVLIGSDILPSELTGLLIIHLALGDQLGVEHSDRLGLYEVTLHRFRLGSNGVDALTDLVDGLCRQHEGAAP